MCICEMLYYNCAWLYMWSLPAVFQTVLLKYHWDTIIVLIEIIYYDYNLYYFTIHSYKVFQFCLLIFVFCIIFYSSMYTTSQKFLSCKVFNVFFKVSSARQSCIYLIQSTAKTRTF